MMFTAEELRVLKEHALPLLEDLPGRASVPPEDDDIIWSIVDKLKEVE